MRSRALIHVGGTPGGGKTTLIECLLEFSRADFLVARCVKDPSANRYMESFPKRDAELRRYRKAGATGTARLTIPVENDIWDAFFCGQFMEDFSNAVLIEGDSPGSFVDLKVFVTRPLGKQEKLLSRSRPATAKDERTMKQTMERILDDPESTENLFIETLGRPLIELMKARPEGLETMRQSMLKQVHSRFLKSSGKGVRKWSLSPEFRGIERAQVVVVNIRSDDERKHADRTIVELRSMREDEAIRRDILGVIGTKIPITALIANLDRSNDPGTKKAVRRIARSIKACKE